MKSAKIQVGKCPVTRETNYLLQLNFFGSIRKAINEDLCIFIKFLVFR